MTKRTTTTLTDLQAELENIERKRAELREQLEGFSALAEARDAIVELRDQLNQLTLSDSIDEMAQLKQDVAQGKRWIADCASQIEGQSGRKGPGRSKGAGGGMRFMTPFGKAFRLRGNQPMTDAELLGTAPVQAYMAAKGLSKGQVLQGIVEMANAGKLESVGSNRYRLPESRAAR